MDIMQETAMREHIDSLETLLKDALEREARLKADLDECSGQYALAQHHIIQMHSDRTYTIQ